MKIPGEINFNNEFDKTLIKDLQIVQIEFSNPNSVETINNLEIIPEIQFNKNLIKKMLGDMDIDYDKPICLASTDVNQFIFNLGIYMALNNKNIRFRTEHEMYYLGKLRRNQDLLGDHFTLIDEDVFYDEDELNLEKYESDDLDD